MQCLEKSNCLGEEESRAVPREESSAVPVEQLTVQDLSESALLARIFPRLHHSPGVLLGPGDDAALIAAPDGRTLISIDTQTQDQDFRLEWPNGYRTTGYDVGWKAAAQNLSDINAMGGSATSLVVSLTMPPATPVEWVEDFADGLTAAIVGLGAPDCSVAGGDLGRGRELAVTVAVVGTLAGVAPVLRSGANPGDIVAVSGTLGRAAAGWALLESEIPLGQPVRGIAELGGQPVPAAASAGRRTPGCACGCHGHDGYFRWSDARWKPLGRRQQCGFGFRSRCLGELRSSVGTCG